MTYVPPRGFTPPPSAYPAATSDIPGLSVVGSMGKQFEDEWKTQEEFMNALQGKVMGFLDGSAARAAIVEQASKILDSFLKPMQKLPGGFNPGKFDISGVFQALDSVMQSMSTVGSALSGVGGDVGGISQATTGLTNKFDEGADEVSDGKPTFGNHDWRTDETTRYGIGYAGGWDKHGETIEKITSFNAQIAVDVPNYRLEMESRIRNLSNKAKNFKNVAKDVKDSAKKCTESTDDFKNFVNNMDMLNRVILGLVQALSAVIATLPLASILHALDTGVMEWIKSIMHEIQEVEQIINSMSNTMESMQPSMDHIMTHVGAPYGAS